MYGFGQWPKELRSGTCSVTEVAFALGYSDVFAFSKDFNKWVGFAPSKWV
ncbi:MAG: helix-turn-helix domain-containing protein [Saprospiraceae bacterium]